LSSRVQSFFFGPFPLLSNVLPWACRSDPTYVSFRWSSVIKRSFGFFFSMGGAFSPLGHPSGLLRHGGVMYLVFFSLSRALFYFSRNEFEITVPRSFLPANSGLPFSLMLFNPFAGRWDDLFPLFLFYSGVTAFFFLPGSTSFSLRRSVLFFARARSSTFFFFLIDPADFFLSERRAAVFLPPSFLLPSWVFSPLSALMAKVRKLLSCPLQARERRPLFFRSSMGLLGFFFSRATPYRLASFFSQGSVVASLFFFVRGDPFSPTQRRVPGALPPTKPWLFQ